MISIHDDAPGKPFGMHDRDRDANNDRRTHKRFPIEGGVFLINNSRSCGIGTVLDIGMGGLSFRSITLSPLKDTRLNISIFSSSNPPTQIKNIPCEVVYNYAPRDTGSTITSRGSIYPKAVNITGVKFANMDSEQTSHIESLIRTLQA